MINVTLIGTGALMPTPKRALTSAFLACGGHSILFDCGEGTQSAASKAGVSLIKTDIIALTHYHGDHIFGLPGLLQTMNSMGRTKPLYIVGPGSIKDELAPIVELAGELPYELHLTELPPDGIKLNSLINDCRDESRLIPFVTEHCTVSQGYRFDLPRAGKFMPEKAKALNIPTNRWKLLQSGQTVQAGGNVILPEMVTGSPRKGLSVVFSGDTRYCQSLVEASHNVDLLICEATYGEDEQEENAFEHGHMTFSHAGMAASRANAKLLWMVHYSQMIKDPYEYLKNALQYFPSAEICEDGKSVTLKFEQ